METNLAAQRSDERVTKKEVIFEQALRVFAQKGFDRTTIDDIAEQAGIAKGTIYYHFKSKNELFAFLLQDGCRLLIQQINDQLDRGGSTRERLEHVIDAHLGFFQDYPDFCTMFLLEVLGPVAHWRDELAGIRHAYLSCMIKLIVEGQNEKIISPMNPQTAMQAIFGTISTVALGRIFHGHKFDASQVSTEIKHILFEGILARSV